MTRVRRNDQSDRRKSARGGILPSCVVESETIDMEMFPGISMDPDIRFGKPCITGTRIDVATLVGAVAAGETVETVADEYALTVEQVRSALSYAAHVAAHLPPAVRQAS
jgi:uncharacterized protein (DUF433 family)